MVELFFAGPRFIVNVVVHVDLNGLLFSAQKLQPHNKTVYEHVHVNGHVYGSRVFLFSKLSHH